MAYLKDIKLCIDCTFYGSFHGQRDRCINPKTTIINPVNGEEVFPLCISERTSISDKGCGSKAQYFVLNTDAEAEREVRRQQFEEAMRDAPF
jgi:hypothetical protein